MDRCGQLCGACMNFFCCARWRRRRRGSVDNRGGYAPIQTQSPGQIMIEYMYQIYIYRESTVSGYYRIIFLYIFIVPLPCRYTYVLDIWPEEEEKQCKQVVALYACELKGGALIYEDTRMYTYTHIIHVYILFFLSFFFFQVVKYIDASI